MKRMLMIVLVMLNSVIVFAQNSNYDFVDLGLSSGTLWATCNVGANHPWEYGNYFAWGETQPKSNYHWTTYKYSCNGQYDVLTKYCNISKQGCNNNTDNLQVLQSSDDAATINMGKIWHIPTVAQWKELIENCTWQWTDNYQEKGVAGIIARSKKYTDRHIFLPAAGDYTDHHFGVGTSCYYWSSSLYEISNPMACLFKYIHSEKVYNDFNKALIFEYYRFLGYSVRAVSNNNSTASINFLSPTTSSSTTYNLRAGIKSDTKITNVSVSVNNARGISPIINNGYDFEINQNVNLTYGNNTITISVTNSSGTTSKSFDVYVKNNTQKPPQQTEKRVALVIGNSNYKNVGTLKNPVNDATDIAAKLQVLGFDVTLKTNLTHYNFETTLKNFKNKASSSDIAILYYAGHGMEIDGINYLIPTDAPINDDDQLKYKSVNANYALDVISGAKKKIIILDACRNNPSSRSILHGGLGVMSATNAFFAYSTSPGKTAPDGAGRNSPYTSALLSALTYKNLTLPQLFQKVSQIVTSKNSSQIPWTSSSLVEDVILNK